MASQLNPAAATRRDGCRSKRPEHLAAERCLNGIGREVTPDEIPRDLGIGQFEKLLERGAFFKGSQRVTLAKVTDQQEVELLHSPAATPFEFFFQAFTRHVGKRRRSSGVRGA